MTKRATCGWLADDTHPAIDVVFQHIGRTWPIEKREGLCSTISQAVFPSICQNDVWKGGNYTLSTVGNQFDYPVTVAIGATPNIWFKNLRLLQVRLKLCLINSLRISMLEPPACASGQIVAKMDVLKNIVEKELIEDHKTPPMKKPRMRVKYPSANIAAESFRYCGLLTMARRN